MIPLSIECSFQRAPKRRAVLQPAVQTPAEPGLGRIPRIARLMALAIKFDTLMRQGIIADYAALARLGHVSRARISQIMSLLQLAPDLQEEILFLAPTERGRDRIGLRQLLPIAHVLDWQHQRARWRRLADP